MLLLILLRKLCGNVQYYQSTKKVQATLDAEVKNKTKKAAKLTVKFDRKNLCSYVPASCTNCPNIINHVNAMFAKTLIWKRMDCFGTRCVGFVDTHCNQHFVGQGSSVHVKETSSHFRKEANHLT